MNKTLFDDLPYRQINDIFFEADIKYELVATPGNVIFGTGCVERRSLEVFLLIILIFHGVWKVPTEGNLGVLNVLSVKALDCSPGQVNITVFLLSHKMLCCILDFSDTHS